MPSSGMLRCVALVRSDVLEECMASIMKVTRFGELGTLAVTTLISCHPNDGGGKFLQNVSSYKSHMA
jgi:hypothetical protein